MGLALLLKISTLVDAIIQAALDNEMSMLKNMGVNVVRVYTGITPKWVKYIYEKYGNSNIILNNNIIKYELF